LESGKIKISNNLRSGIHVDNQGYQLWEYIIENEDGEVTVEIANIDEVENSKGVQLRGTHKDPSGRSSIAPWSNIRLLRNACNFKYYSF
jgi:PIN domain nuclease of toxin-antitoxin system